jgi:hypothetical protein
MEGMWLRFDCLVYHVNADYSKTTCATPRRYRIVLLGNARFKLRHLNIMQVVTTECWSIGDTHN